MLGVVALVGEWRAIERGLPEGWATARLRLRVEDRSQYERAAAALTPLAPGRGVGELQFVVTRPGVGPGSEALVRALRRLDALRVRGSLELVTAAEAEAAPAETRASLAAAWDSEVATLPPDWSDVHAEVELRSSDYLERAALLTAPLNPTRPGKSLALRFRCARNYGYGASPTMVRRCLARLDEEGIRGGVHILRALSETRAFATQGPVWYVSGKAV